MGSLPIVAILGRPNVGKSTLFNRLVGKQRALVEDRPGVTRDRHYAEVEWGGVHFTAVDTGGFEEGEGASLARGIRAQAEKALAEASVAVLVVDAREGVLPDDQLLATVVRRSGKPVLVAANKMDDGRTIERADLASIYALGFPDVFPISAAHGRDIGALLDAAVAALPNHTGESEPERADDVPRVAILGRPNAGKSTLLNHLLGEDRLVVSDQPGTTRDAIEVELRRGKRVYHFVDTAGVRRKLAHGDGLERESAGLAERALERADVVVILFDATEPAVEQDSRLIGSALEHGKALIIAPNKIDLLSGREARTRLRDAIDEHLKFVFAEAPIVELSATEGTGFTKLLGMVDRLFAQSLSRIPTPEINRFLREAEDAHPAPRHGGHPVRLYYMAQVGIRPPTFLVHVNRPEGITDAYRRFLENRMRKKWELQIPLRLVFRKRRR